MSAKVPRRRDKKARELAEQFGVGTRQIQRLVAEPRQDYLARAAAQREQIARLRERGLSYQQIAEEVGCPIGTVRSSLHHHRKYQAESSPK
jgi:DNA-binding NarL/FixJ family response regulator